MIAGSPVVVLDSCVLYPAGLRNLMMWLAVHDLIRPKWSEHIHEEWMRNVLADRPDLTREQLERTRQLMDEHAGDCLVDGFEPRIAELSLPDPDDRHVLAAAIECGADAVVTWNVSDFPTSALAEFDLEVLTPDEMVEALIGSREANVLAAMAEHRASLQSPPKTAAEYLENLQRQGLKETVKRLEGLTEKL